MLILSRIARYNITGIEERVLVMAVIVQGVCCCTEMHRVHLRISIVHIVRAGGAGCEAKSVHLACTICIINIALYVAGEVQCILLMRFRWGNVSVM